MTSVPVLLFKMRCMFFTASEKTGLICMLSQKVLFPFLPFLLWRPLKFYMPCLVRLSLIFSLNGTATSAISFWTLWTIFWLAKTSNKPISLPTGRTWLVVSPNM